MKEHPILFSTPMVQAIRAGEKTMTRRVMTKKNSTCTSLMTGDGQGWHSFDFNDCVIDGKTTVRQYLKVKVPVDDTRHRIFPKYDIGDILWVRETWNVEQYVLPPEGDNDELIYFYKATETKYLDMKWRPSIFMPKAACRIHLEITGIRVEKLNDIKSRDVQDEGAGKEVRQMWLFGLDEKGRDEVYRRSFERLWESINGKGSWNINPWVWVYLFKVIDHG